MEIPGLIPAQIQTDAHRKEVWLRMKLPGFGCGTRLSEILLERAKKPLYLLDVRIRRRPPGSGAAVSFTARFSALDVERGSNMLLKLCAELEAELGPEMLAQLERETGGRQPT